MVIEQLRVFGVYMLQRMGQAAGLLRASSFKGLSKGTRRS
jgi:hypothetical protein